MKYIIPLLILIIIPFTYSYEGVTLNIIDDYLPIIDGRTTINTALLHYGEFDYYMTRSECEIDIFNNIGEHVVDFRSMTKQYNGIFSYEWNNIIQGNYTMIQYCSHGDILDLDRIYLIVDIEVL